MTDVAVLIMSIVVLAMSIIVAWSNWSVQKSLEKRRKKPWPPKETET